MKQFQKRFVFTYEAVKLLLLTLVWREYSRPRQYEAVPKKVCFYVWSSKTVTVNSCMARIFEATSIWSSSKKKVFYIYQAIKLLFWSFIWRQYARWRKFETVLKKILYVWSSKTVTVNFCLVPVCEATSIWSSSKKIFQLSGDKTVNVKSCLAPICVTR